MTYPLHIAELNTDLEASIPVDSPTGHNPSLEDQTKTDISTSPATDSEEDEFGGLIDDSELVSRFSAGHLFDELRNRKLGLDADNTNMTSSLDSSTPGSPTSLTDNAQYPPTSPGTAENKKSHDQMIEDVQRSVEDSGEHAPVFRGQDTTIDHSNEDEAPLDTEPISSPTLGNDPVNNLSDEEDEDALTSGGEEDIMAQFGSGKKISGFVDVHDGLKVDGDKVS